MPKPHPRPRPPESHQESTSRLRDNKRRHRARQKELVSELQRTVAETRERGIQATKEVQIAAQGVARENARLRALLRCTGFEDGVVEAWVREGDGASVIMGARGRGRERGQMGYGKHAAVDVMPQQQQPILIQASRSGEHCSGKDVLPPPNEHCPSACPSETSCSPIQSSDSAQAPCKLVTLLAENPAADVTQVSLALASIQEEEEESHRLSKPIDGIECAAAYSLLMQYATSGESIDRIATALESGCTPSANGGCKVKKSVVWRALDEEVDR